MKAWECISYNGFGPGIKTSSVFIQAQALLLFEYMRRRVIVDKNGFGPGIKTSSVFIQAQALLLFEYMRRRVIVDKVVLRVFM